MALSVSCPFLLSRIALIYKLIFLISVSGVATTWNLSLNEEKCYAFHFYSRLSSASFIYQLNGQQISSKGEGKDLGLTIAADFAWRPHYRLISSKAYKMLALLRRVFSSSVSVSVSAKRSLYISLVRSHLLYCSPIWHPYLLMDIKSLELVQRRATKFNTNYTPIDYIQRPPDTFKSADGTRNC